MNSHKGVGCEAILDTNAKTLTLTYSGMLAPPNKKAASPRVIPLGAIESVEVVQPTLTKRGHVRFQLRGGSTNDNAIEKDLNAYLMKGGTKDKAAEAFAETVRATLVGIEPVELVSPPATDIKGETGPASHGLGFGNGSLIDYGNGTVEFRKTMTVLPAFRVNVADVTGFAVRRVTSDDKKRLKASSLEQVLTVQGNGTVIAEVAVSYGTSEKIEAWFRNHPDWGKRHQLQQQPVGAPSAPDLTAQLAALVSLRDQGALSAEEFERAKAKLLS
ncbi:MAG: DUF4429 domain-containing protein [Nocardiaceae bacterium]|nr:DUF4429 domain-containing protein [Nocardiaceae bacterium]